MPKKPYVEFSVQVSVTIIIKIVFSLNVNSRFVGRLLELGNIM